MSNAALNMLYIGPLRQDSLELIKKNSLESVHLILPLGSVIPDVLHKNPVFSYEIKQLAEQQGLNKLYKYNVEEFNATKLGKDIQVIYPGLRLEEEVEVTCFGPQIVIDIIKDNEVSHLLIEQVEMVFSILKELIECELLTQIDVISFRTMTTQAYHDVEIFEEVSQLLIENGFYQHATETSDPEFPIVRFQKNPLTDKLKEANTTIDTLQKEVEALENKLSNIKNDYEIIEQHYKQLKEQIAEYQEADDRTAENYRMLKRNEKELKHALSVSETQLSLLKSLLQNSDD